jgi:hypothetical protein
MARAAELARLQRQREMMEVRRERARTEMKAVAEGVAETVALSRARGAAICEPAGRRGEPAKPYRRQAGLDWLATKGRLNAAQKAAGERYGALYRRVAGAVRIGSSLDVKPGAGSAGAPLSEVLSRAEGSAQAASRLATLRLRLADHPTLVAACDLICGQELTPREACAGDREAGKLEALLGVALDLLAAEARRS